MFVVFYSVNLCTCIYYLFHILLFVWHIYGSMECMYACMCIHMYFDASSQVLFHYYKLDFFRNRGVSVVDVENCNCIIVQNYVMSSEIGNPLATLCFGFMKLFVKLQIIWLTSSAQLLTLSWLYFWCGYPSYSYVNVHMEVLYVKHKWSEIGSCVQCR